MHGEAMKLCRLRCWEGNAIKAEAGERKGERKELPPRKISIIIQRFSYCIKKSRALWMTSVGFHCCRCARQEEPGNVCKSTACLVPSVGENFLRNFTQFCHCASLHPASSNSIDLQTMLAMAVGWGRSGSKCGTNSA